MSSVLVKVAHNNAIASGLVINGLLILTHPTETPEGIDRDYVNFV